MAQFQVDVFTKNGSVLFYHKQLKELREKEGLTQKELGEKIFVSRSAICKWEMGNGIPSDINLLAICEYFKVKEDWLLDRNDLKVTVKMYKLQIKNIVMSVLLIVIPIILSLLSLFPIFEFGKSGGLNPAVVLPNRSIIYFLEWWSLIPIVIWASNIIFSILLIKNNIIRRRANLNFKISLGLITLSLIIFIVALVVSNNLANEENFWIYLIN